MPPPDLSVLAESLRFVEAIFGPLGSDAGVPAEEVKAAEKRLQLSLPEALRELYRRTGKLASLHAAHNTLVAIDEVDFADDRLIFYEENQGVVAWGIERSRLADADPPVEQGQPPREVGGRWEFSPEFASISEFVHAQAAWQAVNGGLPFVGVKLHQSLSAAVLPALGTPALALVGMRAWLLDRGVVVEAGDSVHAATRDAESFEVTSAQLEIAIDEWDYATLTDDQ